MTNSSEKIIFHVFSRDLAGTNSAKKLRSQGKVVGNIYGLNKNSQSIFMDKQAIKKLYESHGDTGLIYLQVDETKKQVPVLITEFETDSFGKQILHVSFKRVDLSDPIQVEISVSLIGEANIPDAVVSLVKDSVEVEALPANLPEKFEIDISSLSQIGDSINLSQLDYDKSKVKLVLSEEETPESVTLIIVQEIKGEVEEEIAEEVAEVENTQEDSKEESSTEEKSE